MTTAARTDDITGYLFSKVGFEPTEKQTPIIECRKRFILVAGGEQAGKSMIASKYLVSRFLETEESGLYWLVAADYERTRAEFDYLVQDFATLGILAEVSKRVDPGRIVLADGTRIETKSAKDPRTLAMRAPDGIIGCEASQLDLESFHRLRGRCAPKRGWLFLAGTFEGSLGWYPQLFQTWQYGTDEEQSFSLPSYSNQYLYPEGKSDPEILKLKAMASDEFFMERIEGIPSPPQGLVFSEFRPDIHISDTAEWSVGDPVYLWMDPGYAGAYAVEVVQEINGQICVIDEIYEQGLITKEIIEIAQSRPWWKDVQGGVIDIAGYQHQAMSAPAEIWMEETGLYLSGQKIKINDGTERLKGFLKSDPQTNAPKLIVNPKCEGILSEFGAVPNPFDGQTRAYRWKVDRDGNIVGEQPDDKNNHGVKAVIYGLVDRFGYGHLGINSVIKVKRWS
tara:strand:- start:977 stop:2329 length:1353 start_codon:yes stop_codon:yes gene_type:complete